MVEEEEVVVQEEEKEDLGRIFDEDEHELTGLNDG